MVHVGILDRHLAVALVAAAVLTAVVLLGLSGFVSFVEELDWARRHDMGVSAEMSLGLAGDAAITDPRCVGFATTTLGRARR